MAKILSAPQARAEAIAALRGKPVPSSGRTKSTPGPKPTKRLVTQLNIRVGRDHMAMIEHCMRFGSYVSQNEAIRQAIAELAKKHGYKHKPITEDE